MCIYKLPPQVSPPIKRALITERFNDSSQRDIHSVEKSFDDRTPEFDTRKRTRNPSNPRDNRFVSWIREKWIHTWNLWWRVGKRWFIESFVQALETTRGNGGLIDRNACLVYEPMIIKGIGGECVDNSQPAESRKYHRTQDYLLPRWWEVSRLFKRITLIAAKKIRFRAAFRKSSVKFEKGGVTRGCSNSWQLTEKKKKTPVNSQYRARASFACSPLLSHSQLIPF